MEMTRASLPPTAVWQQTTQGRLLGHLGTHVRAYDPPETYRNPPQWRSRLLPTTRRVMGDRCLRHVDGSYPSTPFPWVRLCSCSRVLVLCVLCVHVCPRNTRFKP